MTCRLFTQRYETFKKSKLKSKGVQDGPQQHGDWNKPEATGGHERHMDKEPGWIGWKQKTLMSEEALFYSMTQQKIFKKTKQNSGFREILQTQY